MKAGIAKLAVAVSAALVSFNAPAQLTPPTSGTLDIWFKAPLAGATVSGTLSNDKCYIRGTGVTRVDWFVDSTPIGSDTVMADGMSCVLDTTKFANGAHQLKAVARNSSGRTYTEVVAINISNAVSTPPASRPTGTLNPPGSGPLDIWWKAPAPGQTVKGTMSLANCYVRGSGVTRVDFFLDSTPLNSDTTMADGMSCVLDTTKFANGRHQLRAVARNFAGATYNEVVSIDIQNATTTTTPAPTGSVIAPADIIGQARADIAFAQQPGFSAQTVGTHTNSSAIPESGLHGARLSNGETLRIGKVTDPSNSGRKALAFQVSPGDPVTSGSKRSEFAMAKNIDMNKVYWVALRAFVPDWGTLDSRDVSIFGMQLHSGDDSRGLSPSVSLVSANGGRNFEVLVLHSTSSSPSQSNTVSKRYANRPIPFGRWVDFVFKIRQSTGSSGLLQVWMDGNQIVDHAGPFGFNTPGFRDYFKFGYYNWSSFNSNRKVLLQSPTIVADPSGKYSAADLRAHINR